MTLPFWANIWDHEPRAASVSEAEIVEAIVVARLMKAATVNDTAQAAMEWLRAGRTPEQPWDQPRSDYQVGRVR